jgi:transposase
MNRKRRSFSKEFKRETVALVTEHGYSYAEAGRSLDVEAKLVGRWRRELEAAERGISWQGQAASDAATHP